LKLIFNSYYSISYAQAIFCAASVVEHHTAQRLTI